MKVLKDMLGTAAMIGLITLAIVGTFFSTMDHAIGEKVIVSAVDETASN